MKQQMDSNKLVIEFDNPRMAEHFKVWMCEQGEQDYWIWMEEQEIEDIPIMARFFDYHQNKIIATNRRK